METLKKDAPLESVRCFKMSKKMEAEVTKFVEDRDWKMSAFIRRAIMESMKNVLKFEALHEED